jgi:hypothetical protein
MNILNRQDPGNSDARRKRFRTALCSIFLGCLALVAASLGAKLAAAEKGVAVTQWTLTADFYGRHSANWRTLAIMHMAMHDALNAVQPVYARWSPATPDEPPASGANPQVAMAAAAHEVLLLLHPDRRTETDAQFANVLSHVPNGPGKQAGIKLGAAIGAAAVQHRADDGWSLAHDFVGTDAPGRWRPTPTAFATSPTNDARPFLFASVAAVATVPPPDIDRPLFKQQMDETQRVGGLDSNARTQDQTLSAEFWASQSSQRGFVYLAVELYSAHPHRLAEEARVMSQLTVALADSAILIWGEKQKFNFWRPITAIRATEKDAASWLPLVETPPFPEYPSGHASDCYTGAGVLSVAFPGLRGPITYTASTSIPPLHREPVPGQPPDGFGMGQHAQAVGAFLTERRFPNLAASATDCALSRIWAGAHFRAADDEAKRIADLIVQRAVASLPPEK